MNRIKERAEIKFCVRDREAGNVIDWFDTKEEAEQAMTEFEESDKEEGIYSEGFYEVAEIYVIHRIVQF